MEIQIKDLAPYLPYGLKVQTINVFEGNPIFTMCDKSGLSNVSISDILDYQEEYKPILRPLSDLSIEIIKQLISFDIVEFRMSKEIEDDFSIEVNDEAVGWTSLTFQEYQNIISWKFDIFNLIPQGLAIDVNEFDVAVY